MTNRKLEYWVIPPKADAEFVAHMEAVLDIYAQPYDRSEEHTSELQSLTNLVCRLLLEKKKKKTKKKKKKKNKQHH